MVKNKNKPKKQPTTAPNLLIFLTVIYQPVSFIIPNSQHPNICKEKYPIFQVFSAKALISKTRQNNYSHTLNYICMYVTCKYTCTKTE